MKTIVHIYTDEVSITCGACPFQVEWDDKDDNYYYFRMRHDYAMLLKNGKIIVADEMLGFDIGCSIEDMIEWLEGHDVMLHVKEIGL